VKTHHVRMGSALRASALDNGGVAHHIIARILPNTARALRAPLHATNERAPKLSRERRGSIRLQHILPERQRPEQTVPARLHALGNLSCNAVNKIRLSTNATEVSQNIGGTIQRARGSGSSKELLMSSSRAEPL